MTTQVVDEPTRDGLSPYRDTGPSSTDKRTGTHTRTHSHTVHTRVRMDSPRPSRGIETSTVLRGGLSKTRRVLVFGGLWTVVQVIVGAPVAEGVQEVGPGTEEVVIGDIRHRETPLSIYDPEGKRPPSSSQNWTPTGVTSHRVSSTKRRRPVSHPSTGVRTLIRSSLLRHNQDSGDGRNRSTPSTSPTSRESGREGHSTSGLVSDGTGVWEEGS